MARRIAILLALFLAAPALAQTIRLGELNEYKQFPAFLDPYRKGMELAVDEINAAGGVLGRRIEVVSRDDNGVPGDAVRVAEELLTRERVALRLGVAGAREREHATSLEPRDLRREARGVAEPVQADRRRVAGHPEGPEADRAGAEQRRRLDVGASVGDLEARAAIREEQLRVSAGALVAGEASFRAQVLAPG